MCEKDGGVLVQEEVRTAEQTERKETKKKKKGDEKDKGGHRTNKNEGGY